MKVIAQAEDIKMINLDLLHKQNDIQECNLSSGNAEYLNNYLYELNHSLLNAAMERKVDTYQ